ncbi:MAG: ANTAR domain-containing protein [Rhizobiaceae bacterium]|nr:ANTAR domain-containing protein [Rhizobiaceae bacterium]
MSGARFVQNFSQRRALIASLDPRVIDALSATLGKLGLHVEVLCGDGTNAPVTGLDAARDLLFLDGDIHAPPIMPAGAHPDLPAVPVIGLVGVEAPSRLRALMQAGATAFLQKPVYGGSVYSALYLCVNEHSRKTALCSAVEELEQRRRQRRYIVKAILMTVADRVVDDETAFQSLRREAMRARLSLEAHCERIVHERTNPNLDNPAAPLARAALD